MISKLQNIYKNLNKFVRTVGNTDSVVIKSNDGSDAQITYLDFKTKLEVDLGVVAGPTGTDGVFDCGDRMTGNEVLDMGNRV